MKHIGQWYKVDSEEWKTHLKAGHSQLRQTIHVWTQDFMFANFQGLSAPSKTEESIWLIQREEKKREDYYLFPFFIWHFSEVLFMKHFMAAEKNSLFRALPFHSESLMRMNENLNTCFRKSERFIWLTNHLLGIQTNLESVQSVFGKNTISEKCQWHTYLASHFKKLHLL